MQSSYREVLRCLLEGIQWLCDPSVTIKVAGKSGISQARTRLGWEPLRQLHDEVVKPIAVTATKGAWYWCVAVGEFGWQHVGRGRREGQCRCPRAAGGEPRQQRLSANPFRGAGRKRHARVVRQPAGCLHRRGNHAGENRAAKLTQKACSVWPTEIFSATHSGSRRAPQARICCGGSRRLCAWPVKRDFPTGPI